MSIDAHESPFSQPDRYGFPPRNRCTTSRQWSSLSAYCGMPISARPCPSGVGHCCIENASGFPVRKESLAVPAEGGVLQDRLIQTSVQKSTEQNLGPRASQKSRRPRSKNSASRTPSAVVQVETLADLSGRRLSKLDQPSSRIEDEALGNMNSGL